MQKDFLRVRNYFRITALGAIVGSVIVVWYFTLMYRQSGCSTIDGEYLLTHCSMLNFIIFGGLQFWVKGAFIIMFALVGYALDMKAPSRIARMIDDDAKGRKYKLFDEV